MARIGPLPEGTVTLVFTDMEGSTRALQALGDAWPGVLGEHLRLLRGVTERHGGVELGSDGDGLALVFADASSAVAASMEMQRAMTTHPWPAGVPLSVRIAIHSGDVRVVDDEYVGLPLHVTARVRSVTHGGQVVLTETTRQLAGAWDVVDLGEHWLRDLSEPVRLHQLVVPGCPSSFPPPRSLEAHPNNLPVPVDSFVGRRREIGELTKALATHRLVTLTGPGGAGKTRLGLRVAGDIVGEYRDGAWLVELGFVAEPSRVVPTVAATLRVGERTGEPILETLLRWLAPREMLLIADNCEHVIDVVAALIEAVVTSCPGVTVLATSREVLGLRGEVAMSVPPLPARRGSEEHSDAFELFVDRAASAGAVLDLSAPAVPPLVDQLCRRLDGLPLALELAAGRLRTMSLQQLVDRLDDRFHLLTGGTRAGLAHQRTLEAVVAWSYGLLDDAEQVLFRRLALFPDTFSLDAAEAMAAAEPRLERSALEVLPQLVGKSLLTTMSRPADVRYYLLETLRQYAYDRLVERDEVRQAGTGMLAWAESIVARLERDIRTPLQHDSLTLAAVERVNLRRALTFAEERGDRIFALRLVSAAPLGLNSEREAKLTELLQPPGEVPAGVAAAAYLTQANLAIDRGDGPATLAAAAAALDAADRDGDRIQQTWARYFLLFGHWSLGQLDETRQLQAICSATFAEIGVPLGSAYMLWIGALLEADLRTAETLAKEAERSFRALGDRSGLAHSLEAKALVALEADDRTTAGLALSEAAGIYFGDDNTGCASHCVEAIAAHALHSGRVDAARQLTAAATGLRHAIGRGYSPWEVHRRANLMAALRAVGPGPVDEATEPHDAAAVWAMALDYLDASTR
jgi:predicted ATPase/class 3 adenylate cyclase